MKAMRTIKFRGKRVDNGEWVYGYYYTNNLGSQHMIKVSDDSFSGNLEIHPETVGQFTGLHDKEGNEIYEGDVLKLLLVHSDYANFFWEVFYDDGSFQLKTLTKVGRVALQKHILNAFRENIILEFSDYPCLFEVVNNIHDNPELIEEDEK